MFGRSKLRAPVVDKGVALSELKTPKSTDDIVIHHISEEFARIAEYYIRTGDIEATREFASTCKAKHKADSSGSS